MIKCATVLLTRLTWAIFRVNTPSLCLLTHCCLSCTQRVAHIAWVTRVSDAAVVDAVVAVSASVSHVCRGVTVYHFRKPKYSVTICNPVLIIYMHIVWWIYLWLWLVRYRTGLMLRIFHLILEYLDRDWLLKFKIINNISASMYRIFIYKMVDLHSSRSIQTPGSNENSDFRKCTCEHFD